MKPTLSEQDAPLSLTRCRLCPRNCGVDRSLGQVGFSGRQECVPQGSLQTPPRGLGYCGGGALARVSQVMLHHWEEPCISGALGEKDPRGSGAVFFTHCNLSCVYCQNRDISRRDSTLGEDMDTRTLANAFLDLQKQGAYNLNLVTPTPYGAQIAAALRLAKAEGLTLPVIWNTGGYESAPVLEALAGLVDIFLTDFKYADPALAQRLSHAADYPLRAQEALAVMVKLVGPVQFSPDGMLKKGVLLRHLCLPGYRKDSLAVLRLAASAVDPAAVRLSLMRQYTPDFLPPSCQTCPGEEIPQALYRHVTSFEYQSVVEEALRLGFDGYTQDKTSAHKRYTPDFF